MDKCFQSEDEIFSAALELPEGDRAGFLDSQCVGNPKLREQIESLLRSTDEAKGFLETSAFGAAPQLLSAVLQRSAETSDGMIGPYQLRERIGEGGCGVVYLAEQHHPIRRSVALKVIKQGMDTEAVIARFEAERQALALMEHPHIARVYDAGVTPKGRPYFAMELVHGKRVTDYCHKNKLTIEERVALFISICQAVQHAHLKGVIHRDLKPSNILITVQDGTPVPKLIDFGIAKAIQGRLTDFTLVTSLDQFIGTPAYTSPEQFSATAALVDTRSDLYSLGVVLYELLTGTPPFGREESEDLSLDLLIRKIREEDPVRPSTQLSRIDSAHYPLTSNKKLVAQLRGDLDWIVLRCLEKDPARRYQSAHELVNDLNRFLLHEPLVNRPSNTWRTLGRTIRKHRSSAAFSLALVATLVTATAISRNQAIHARRSEKKALDAEKKARAEIDANKAVLEFLKTDLLDFSTPEKQSEGKLKLRTLIDNARQKVDEGRFKGQPDIENEIRATLAHAYGSMGLYVDSAKLWDQVVIYDRSNFGDGAPETLTSSINVVNSLALLGQFADAEKLAEHTLPLVEKFFGPDSKETAKLLQNLGQIFSFRQKRDLAEAALSKSVDILTRKLGAEDPKTLSARFTLATIYWEENQNTRCEKAVEEIRDAYLRASGRESIAWLSCSGLLAEVGIITGQLSQADKQLDENYHTYLRKWGAEYPSTVLTRIHMAYVAMRRRQFEAAEKTLREIDDTTKSKTGFIKFCRLEAHLALAEILVYLGRTTEARTLSNEIHADLQKMDSVLEYAIWDRCVRAEIELKEGNLEEAEKWARPEKEERPNFFGPVIGLLDMETTFGRVLLAERKYQSAEREFRRVLANEEKAEPPLVWVTEYTRLFLSETLTRENKIAEAHAVLETSAHALEAAKDKIPPFRQWLVQDVQTRLAALSAASAQASPH